MADAESPAAWQAADLDADRSWMFSIDEAARAHLARAVKAAYVADRPFFDYAREDFDLEPAWPLIAEAFNEAKRGRGFALVRGLPREGLTEREFELMNWAIGLYIGVARPQGRASQYISAVRDIGTDYRAASGRGYSSSAKLDFHVDDADLVTLSCYNKAKSGGMSMFTSGITAYRQLLSESPDLAEVARQEFFFSRQGEEAPDELPFYRQPLFGIADGRVFGKCNRNRIQSAQQLEGVPRLSDAQLKMLDILDAILHHPEFMFTMNLESGDLQIMNNHVILHSRTHYTDFADLGQKRLLFRLWLAHPDSPRLPASWKEVYRSVEPGTVRGGIRGQMYDDSCRAFEIRQASRLGMIAGHRSRKIDLQV